MVDPVGPVRGVPPTPGLPVPAAEIPADPSLPRLQVGVRGVPGSLPTAILTAPVSGVVGAARADGLLPVLTGQGPVLVQPPPGAAGDLPPPGTGVQLVPLAGGRLATLTAAPVPNASTNAAAGTANPATGGPSASTAAGPSAGPVPVRSVIAAETAVRGLLALARVDAAQPGAGQVRVPVAVAVAPAGPSDAPLTAALPAATNPATNPAIAANAARIVALAADPPAPLPAGPMTRPPAGAETPGAVARPPEATGTRLDGATPRDPRLPPPASPAIAPSALIQPPAARPVPGLSSLPPDATAGPARQGVELLQAALADPALLRQVAPLLPRPDRGRTLGQALLLYLFGVRAGGPRAWLGDRAADAAVRLGAGAALETLDAAQQARRQPTAEGTWQTVAVPLALSGGDDQPVPVLFAWRLEPDPERPEIDRRDAAADGLTGEGDAAATVRFVVGVELSRLGPAQIRGVFRRAGLSLDVTLDSALAAALATGMPPGWLAGVEAAMAPFLGPGGRLRLDMAAAMPLPELMPAAGRHLDRSA